MGKKFQRLEEKIARTEHKEHPSYSAEHIKYIASAAAGKVAREKHGGCQACRMGMPHKH